MALPSSLARRNGTLYGRCRKGCQERFVFQEGIGAVLFYKATPVKPVDDTQKDGQYCTHKVAVPSKPVQDKSEKKLTQSVISLRQDNAAAIDFSLSGPSSPANRTVFQD